jgi:protein-S-isoprenylcysteine O-methyltransferase Ste14
MGTLKPFLYWVDVMLCLMWTAFLALYSPRGPQFYAGMTLAAVAFPFWMTARVQLGSSFSVTAKARRLVTTGLYARFRSPIYLFGGLTFGGLALAWGNPLGWVCVLTMIPMQYLRIRREDAILEKAFGEKYRLYKSRTWF